MTHTDHRAGDPRDHMLASTELGRTGRSAVGDAGRLCGLVPTSWLESTPIWCVA